MYNVGVERDGVILVFVEDRTCPKCKLGVIGTVLERDGLAVLVVPSLANAVASVKQGEVVCRLCGYVYRFYSKSERVEVDS